MGEFTWSYSALKDYVNCPRQYQEVKILKRFVKKATKEMLYGVVVHKACEDYVRDGTPLAKNYERYKPMLDTLLEIKGTRYPEYQMALDRDRSPCKFNSPDRWVRGIVDLLIVDGDTAFIVDYKTGSNKYPDTKQLKLMALMTFAYFPKVERIKAGLLFVAHNSFMTEEYNRNDMETMWGHFDSDLRRLEYSYNSDVWNPNPTPLCGWCPVSNCVHHRER
jgi:hypothetical protein